MTLSPKAATFREPEKSRRSSDIRVDLVEKYKEDINTGKYRVKTNEIVDKMVQKFTEETFYKRIS